MTKKEIYDFCSGCAGSYYLRENVFKEKFKEEYYEIISYKFPEGFSFIQKLFHWLNDDMEFKLGLCFNCGKRCKFISFGKGYRKYCSKQCIYTEERSEKCAKTKYFLYGDANYNNKEKNKKTCLEKYGVENVFSSKEIKEKIKETNIEKYGVEYPMQNSEIYKRSEKTFFKKYGVKNPMQNSIIYEKALDKKHKKYGVHCEKITEKTKRTKLEKYGDEKYVNPEKAKNTKLEKYGDEKYVNPEKAKNTKLEKYGCSNFVNFEKIKKTRLERYGDENYNNREKFKRTIHSEQYSMKRKLSYDRLLNDYKNRHLKTHGGLSKLEIMFYDFLVGFFGYENVHVQFSSLYYPFHCDFYISTLDLYIELNGHWTHGEKPFEGSADDFKLLEFWKSKNSRYYDNAIETWTVRDIEKRKYAKENDLNYVEIFSNDVNECIDILKKIILNYE